MLNDGDDVSRRSFLKLLGASLALAGLDGCNRMPAEKILPYVNQPPELTPGIPVHYATSMVLDGVATGLVVESHEGRPTKIEGNPDHPASLGATGMLEQASLLQLYDPNRGTRVRSGRAASSWQAFAAAFGPGQLRSRVGHDGERLALLLEPTSSPLIADLLARLQTLYPRMSVYYYSPLVQNESVLPLYDLDQADVILSVDSDFLCSGPFNLRYARQFANRRRSPGAGMNRLYAMEGRFTVTGATADHHLRCRPTMMADLLAQVSTNAHPPQPVNGSLSTTGAWLHEAGLDLHAHAGRSLVIAGNRVSPRARAIADSINIALGNFGRTVWHAPSPLLGAGDIRATFPTLVEAMRGGAIDTLVCIGGNPAYASPSSLGFAEWWRKVPNAAYIGLYENETAVDAHWFVPAAHYLESWGDARAADGTLSVVQPLVQPLHESKSSVEVLAALAGLPSANALELLRTRRKAIGAAPDDDAWSDALRRGFVPNSRVSRPSTTPTITAGSEATTELLSDVPPGQIEVLFAPDSRVHDGSFANNAWLQELPDPVTKLTWDNAAMVSPSTAARLKVETGDSIVLELNGSSLEVPVLIVPGHADDLATLSFGYGRSGAEEVARGVGSDAYRLWPGIDQFVAHAAVRRGSAPHHDFAVTQTHWRMEGRDQARSATLAEYRAQAASSKPARRRELTVYDPVQRLSASHQWAMTIDLGTCIGCSACTIACQAENNIPVVGKDDVMKSREMHWLRIDRYLEGADEDPQIVTQPMLCQQCENAPCEYVCPVGATTHSDDGLNEMVYNRCVGTRFCSNNCPYKVRRFNWFDYNAHLSELERMVKNPDVTVRERGVMEKCTFCVQRIREAEIAAGVAGRPLRGDEVKTACQQACPTNAIVFGSLTEPDSEVVKRRDEKRVYDVLEELGTEPRVRYLARVRNPNPALESAR